jgi:hypothetical protein
MTRDTQDEARRYLLGRLSEDEAERLERAYFGDESRADAIAAAESDLVDAYVAGTLPPPDREAFEAYYLSSPVHRDRVETARLLAAAAAGAAAGRRPIAAWLGLAAAAAALAVFVFHSSRPSPRMDRRAVSVPSPTPPPASPTPAATPVVAPSPPNRTLAFALASVRVRGDQGTPELRLPPGVDEVALELEDAGGQAGLSFSVRTVEGTRVASGRVERRGGSSRGVARVAAARLRPDDYIVAVSAAGEPPVAQYFFRITR